MKHQKATMRILKNYYCAVNKMYVVGLSNFGIELFNFGIDS